MCLYYSHARLVYVLILWNAVTENITITSSESQMMSNHVIFILYLALTDMMKWRCLLMTEKFAAQTSSTSAVILTQPAATTNNIPDAAPCAPITVLIVLQNAPK